MTVKSPSIQDLVLAADPKMIEEYLHQASWSGRDEDRYQMVLAIVEMGLTSHLAAKQRHQSGESDRDFFTLRHHARGIVIDLYEFLGRPISELMAELERDEEIFVAPDQMGEMRRGAEAMGFDVLVDSRVRLVGRR